MSIIIAFVGLPGSGKTEASKVLEEIGFARVRFGDVTDEELKKRGLEVNEENEKRIREELRRIHGMDAFAKLNEPRINRFLEEGKDVVIDGLRSFDEFLYLKSKYNGRLKVIAIFTSPAIKYERMIKREVRGLSSIEECKKRDIAELRNLDMGGSIAMADETIINDGSLEDLKNKVLSLVKKYKENNL